ncbi:hypothetical protein IV203_038710 [Nitzschia inconspicua]|uniref:Uncharacterized protein n=1 Tax=Nitzschia inconspicua TaxID=303405 RepID=A0A9K3LRW2_9STRA|nr:hypothetical protein IV203_038710 [Nitzschia inconspicua]
MSDISKTAPDMSKQFVRAAILIAILSVSVTFNSSNSNSNQYQHVLTLVHLLSFMSWFGCSIWVSFVGLT